MIAFVAPLPAAAAYAIDDFEGPSALEDWRFSGSPAASGALALGPGHRGHGAALTYRIACNRLIACEDYAAAVWRPASRLPKRHSPAISLWIRFPPDVEVSFVAKDSGGQTLRFPIQATLESPKAGDWQYVVVPLRDDADNGATGRIEKALVEIDVVVRARVRATVQGAVDFDDVFLRESSEVFRVDAAAQVGGASAEPLELAPIGVNIHLLRDNPSLDLAHAAGFGFVRMDMLWANVERAGRYRFFAYDALLRALDARGMGLLWILDYGHPDHGGSPPRTPQDVAAFGRFAEAAAAHFKGRNVRYEVWNEPDTNQFWAPSPNADEYAVLLREAVAAIHRGDPSAKVSSGGVSGMDVTFLSGVVDPILAGGLSAIGVHPYPKAGPESIAPALGILREWSARALGERVEIWDTEWGYSSNGHSEGGRRRQAGLAVREILTVWSLGLPMGVWYDLRDDGPDAANPEHNYGLLDVNGNEKPAMKAVRTLLGAVRGRKYAGMIQETPAGMHAMRLDGAADRLFVVWSGQAGSKRKVEYAKQDLLSATDLMGRAVPSKDRASGEAQVEIDKDAGPIYLLYKLELQRKQPVM